MERIQDFSLALPKSRFRQGDDHTKINHHRFISQPNTHAGAVHTPSFLPLPVKIDIVPENSFLVQKRSELPRSNSRLITLRTTTTTGHILKKLFPSPASASGRRKRGGGHHHVIRPALPLPSVPVVSISPNRTRYPPPRSARFFYCCCFGWSEDRCAPILCKKVYFYARMYNRI